MSNVRVGLQVVVYLALGSCSPAEAPPSLSGTSQGSSAMPERDPRWGRTEGGLKVCADGPTVFGVDVSQYQGAIDWPTVAASGVTFAITRIGHGTKHDTYFETNWAAIKANGMVRGAYLFYAPTQDATLQAQHIIDSVGMLEPGDLPVTIDSEWTTGDPNAAHLATVVDLVQQGTGKRPMIYTATGYWNQYFSTEFGDLDLWVANWETNCPSIPSSWSGWLFWQTSGGGGTVPGIAGGVDEDVFNGTLDDLKKVAGLPTNTNCSATQSNNCGMFGCGCADNTCSGAYCEGTGCSAKTTENCGSFACGCVDGACSGGACEGTGCTIKETADCSSFGCGCVDHACSGGACAGTGCTYKEAADCGNFGCGCDNHACACVPIEPDASGPDVVETEVVAQDAGVPDGAEPDTGGTDIQKPDANALDAGPTEADTQIPDGGAPSDTPTGEPDSNADTSVPNPPDVTPSDGEAASWDLTAGEDVTGAPGDAFGSAATDIVGAADVVGDAAGTLVRRDGGCSAAQPSAVSPWWWSALLLAILGRVANKRSGMATLTSPRRCS